MPRPEVTGSAPAECGAAFPPTQATPAWAANDRIPRAGILRPAQDFSKAHFYNLRRQGLGPRETDVNGVTIITAEDAAAWRAGLSAMSARKSADKAETGQCRPVVSSSDT